MGRSGVTGTTTYIIKFNIASYKNNNAENFILYYLLLNDQEFWLTLSIRDWPRRALLDRTENDYTVNA